MKPVSIAPGQARHFVAFFAHNPIPGFREDLHLPSQLKAGKQSLETPASEGPGFGNTIP
jgi:hypothetical protein